MSHYNLLRAIKNDINLLITLYFLLKTKNVSITARCLYIGQSAVSHQLSRLREMFEDPLLIRAAGGMLLTPFAERLYPSLEIIVTQIENLLESPRLKKDKVIPLKKLYRVCVPEDLYIDDISLLLFDFANNGGYANEVTFEVIGRYERCISDLNEGKIDFLFGHTDEISINIMKSKLIEMPVHFAVRCGHPLAENKVELHEILTYPLIEVLYRQNLKTLSDTYWGSALRKMDCMFKCSSAKSAISLLNKSDALCLFSFDAIRNFELSKVDIIGSTLKVNHYLYWHKIMNDDPFHRHIREVLFTRFVDDKVLTEG